MSEIEPRWHMRLMLIANEMTGRQIADALGLTLRQYNAFRDYHPVPGFDPYDNEKWNRLLDRVDRLYERTCNREKPRWKFVDEDLGKVPEWGFREACGRASGYTTGGMQMDTMSSFHTCSECGEEFHGDPIIGHEKRSGRRGEFCGECARKFVRAAKEETEQVMKRYGYE